MIPIWQRYFLKEISKVTFLFLFCFFFLYFLIDYSSRGNYLISQSPLSELLFYYLLIFLRNVDIILPFSLMLATIRTLCASNLHNELVALLTCGLRLQTLLRPFLLAGLIGVVFMYVNFEIILPKTLYKARKIEAHYNHPRSEVKLAIHDLVLEDDSIIIYQSYDPLLERFFDAFWIRSIDDIYRIKYLYPDKDFPIARFVDHLARNPEGELLVTEFFDSKILSEMKFDEKRLLDALRTMPELSLSQLWDRASTATAPYSDKEAQALAWWYKRMTMPWLCLLAIIGPAPYCVSFTRQLRTFLIYILCTLTLITFYLLINAGMVMAQAQVIPPALAIGGSFIVALSFLGFKFVRLA